MANNKLSQMLEYDTKYHPMWSAKLDRLVEAAREAFVEIRKSANPHMPLVDELTAALRDIELETN